MFGVIVIGGLAQLDIANGQYELQRYRLFALSLILAFYSIIKHKFGELINLLLFLPRETDID